MFEIPNYTSIENYPFNEWLSETIREFFHITGKEPHIREYSIIEYSFGLNGKPLLTLDDIGVIQNNVSRENIRQIEKRALENLSVLFMTGTNPKREVQLKSNVFTQINSYRESFKKLNKIENEISIINHSTEYFSEATIDLPIIRLFLTSLGFKKISIKIGSLEKCYVWAFEEIDSKRIEMALNAIYEYLRDVCVAKPIDEIKLAINKKRKTQSRFNDFELDSAINLSPDIEKLEDTYFQIKYDQLPSINAKAYRILHNFGDPLRSQQLALLLNREAFKYGEISRITSHHIGTRLSTDERFESIGRNGGWKLSQWEKYSL